VRTKQNFRNPRVCCGRKTSRQPIGDERYAPQIAVTNSLEAALAVTAVELSTKQKTYRALSTTARFPHRSFARTNTESDRHSVVKFSNASGSSPFTGFRLLMGGVKSGCGSGSRRPCKKNFDEL
jgi:hypothetical protein